MTVAELVNEIRHEIHYLFSLQLSFWTKIQLAFLKLLAVLSYRRGKVSASANRMSSKGKDHDHAFEPPLELNHFHSLDLSNKEKCRTTAIIPAFVRNDHQKRQLMRAVDSIQSQVGHVLVIDDHSPCQIPAFAGNVTVICLHKNQGPATARNVGLKLAHASGSDYAFFLDSDCIASSTWASHLRNKIESSDEAVAAGGNTFAFNTTTHSPVPQYHDVFGTLNGRRFLNSENLVYAPTCNFGISLKRLPKNLSFTTSYSSAAYEDIDFCMKLIRNDPGAIVYASQARMYHDYDTSVYGFCRQFYRYGAGEPLFLKENNDYWPYFAESERIPAIHDKCQGTSF